MSSHPGSHLRVLQQEYAGHSRPAGRANGVTGRRAGAPVGPQHDPRAAYGKDFGVGGLVGSYGGSAPWWVRERRSARSRR